ncbi:MAG: M48 family metalloprotease [Methanomassiliicoccales archaeon]|jgi:Zn-dependent protease with chaperone function
MDDVRNVFDELVSKGLISSPRVLVRKSSQKKIVVFQAWRFHLNRIYVSGDLSRLSAREIAFGLLHEEGHLAEKQNRSWIIWIYIGTLIALFASALFPWGSGFLGSISSVIAFMAILFFLILMPRIFRRWFYADEFKADAFSASRMFLAFPGIMQEDVAGAARSVLRAVSLRGDAPQRGKTSNLYRFFSSHPPNEERVEAILHPENRVENESSM